jgi:catechol 2,3-dioxygenase-like lactoylglutathione lyase family enzyme
MSINNIYIPVTSIKESNVFYEKILGLKKHMVMNI